ncbi:MAG: hypothetical protein KGV50_02730 [Gammaproteobacteria bacterium]|nr:hypothetical protein [Gammaproteobacteria bacterium]
MLRPISNYVFFSAISYFFLALGLMNYMFYEIGINYPAFYSENGLLENSEVIVLFFAMMTFLLGLPQSEFKSIAYFSSAVCFAFILRELDVEKLNVPDIFVLLGSGKGRNILLAGVFILGLYFLAKQIKISMIKPLICSKLFITLLFSPVFFVASWICDKEVINAPSLVLFEEISEFNAYFIIFMASIIHFFEFKKTK